MFKTFTAIGDGFFGTQEFDIFGITGFFGNTGSGKSRILNLIYEYLPLAKNIVLEPTESGAKTFETCCPGPVCRFTVDHDFSLEKGSYTYLFSDPEDILRDLYGSRSAKSAAHQNIRQALVSVSRVTRPGLQEVPGPVGKIFNEVLRERRFNIGVFDARKQPLPGSLQPFDLLERMLKWQLLHPGDLLMIDNAGAGMHPCIQVIYTKLLVLLYKQFGIQLILAGNDFDFWEGIQGFAHHYELRGHVGGYLLHAGVDGINIYHKFDKTEAEFPEAFDQYNYHFDMLNEEMNKDPEEYDWAIKTEEKWVEERKKAE